MNTHTHTHTHTQPQPQPHTERSPQMLMWIAGIAVIVFSVGGVAAIMGWI
ncbi:MAG: hypothetical protein ABIS45_08465 [Burkholderiales bacterium]